MRRPLHMMLLLCAAWHIERGRLETGNKRLAHANRTFHKPHMLNKAYAWVLILWDMDRRGLEINNAAR